LRAGKKQLRSGQRSSSQGLRALPFLVPALIVFSMMNLYPLIHGISRSFYAYHARARADVFVGWENFTLLFDDPTFFRALSNNIVWTVVSVAAMFIFSYALATLLNSKYLRFRRAFQAAAIIPWALPRVVVSLIWRYIFLPDGALNAMLAGVGIQGPGWLTDPSLALWTCAVANMWIGVPFVTVMLLAGLQSLDGEMLEAAVVDGASYFQTQVRVILPSIRRVIIIVLMLEAIWTFNGFEIVFVMTQGGPGNASMLLPLYGYLNAFMYYQPGYGAAIGVVSLAIVLGAIALYIREVLK